MIEVIGTTLSAILIGAGVLVLMFLVWVAATSKSFLARSSSWLVVAEVGMVFVVTFLAVADVLAWWAAVPLLVLGSRIVFLALRRALPVGLSRFKAELREAAPDHWRAGEMEGKQAAEGLTAVPRSRQEAVQMRDELLRSAERTHLEREQHDGTHRCYAFRSAFGDGFWGSVWSAGYDLPVDLSQYRKKIRIVRWVVLSSVLVRLIGGLIILGIALSPRDSLPIRVLELAVGLWLFVWGASGFRLWRHPDWRKIT